MVDKHLHNRPLLGPVSLSVTDGGLESGDPQSWSASTVCLSGISSINMRAPVHVAYIYQRPAPQSHNQCKQRSWYQASVDQ